MNYQKEKLGNGQQGGDGLRERELGGAEERNTGKIGTIVIEKIFLKRERETGKKYHLLQQQEE